MLKNLFPSHVTFCFQISFINPDGSENLHPEPPFQIKLPKTLKSNVQALPGNKSNVAASTDGDVSAIQESLIVETYIPPDPGPYPQDKPKQNAVRFTPTQVLSVTCEVKV